VCRSDADCRLGTKCTRASGKDEGLCIAVSAAACTKACGDGFRCEMQPDRSEKCTATRSASVSVARPSPGALTRGQVVEVVCTAEAPRIRRVSASATGADGAPTVLPDPSAPEPGRYATLFDPRAAPSPDGEYSIGCRLEYGPDGDVVVLDSTAVVLRVDTTPPAIVHRTPAGWHRLAGTLSLIATIADSGSGMEADSVYLAMPGPGPVAGIAGSDGAFTFEVDLAQILPADVQGPVTYAIRAQDAAGNEAIEQYSLQMDARGPVATVSQEAQDAWHGLDSGSFSLTAEVSATGAPVASVHLRNADATFDAAGAPSGAVWSFDVDPPQFGHIGVEGASAWSLVATDEAGNESMLEGVLHVDGKAPSVAISPDGTWHARGAAATVSVTAADAGMGVDPGSVALRGGAACTQAGAGTFTCSVPTDAAPAGAETPDLAFVVEASDHAGNSASGSGTVRVDDRPPAVAVTPDARWHPRSGTIVLRAAASDAGAGLYASAKPTVSFPDGSRYEGDLDAAGAVSVVVRPSEFTAAGSSNNGIVFELSVSDALGNTGTASGTVAVDDGKPVVSRVSVTYAGGETKALRRDPAGTGRDKATVAAGVSDGGSGVNPDALVLEYRRRDGTTRQQAPDAPPVDGSVVWTLDVSDAAFAADQGELDPAPLVRAADQAGNGASAPAAVSATRSLWVYASGQNLKTSGALAYGAGRVYFALPNGGLADNVFALDAATGAKAWAGRVAGSPTTPVSLGATLAYVGSDAEGGSLHAFDLAPASAEAAEAWRCTEYGTARGALAVGTVSWQTSASETVFYASDEPMVYALRRNAEGTDCEARTAQIGTLATGDAVVSLSRTSLFFGSGAGMLGRNDFTTSRPLMTNFVATGPATDPVSGPALDSAGLPFFQNRGFVSRLSPAFVETWRGSSPTYGQRSLAPPALGSDDAVYFGTEDGYLFAFDTSSPSPRWTFAVRDAQGSARPVRTTPVVGSSGASRQLYFGAGDRRMHALSADGTPLWTRDAGSEVESSAVLDCRGILYFATNNGRVAALVTDSDAIADTPWPRFQHDNRNSGSAATALRAAGACAD